MRFLDEVQQLMARLSRFGAQPQGGYTRLLYDDAWQTFQKEVLLAMGENGLVAAFDHAGNIVGRMDGTVHNDAPVVTGSHADTVKNGGNVDGQLGVVCGILAAGYLLKTHGPPRRCVEVVSFAEEEGSRFPYIYWGSKNYLGTAGMAEVAALQDAEGVPFAVAMERAGFVPEADLREQKKVHAFVELHAEQGERLCLAQKQIGIVTGIVGQRRYAVTLDGQANHAGTTPMAVRRDALVGFARMVAVLTDRAAAAGDPLVLTFGKVEAFPGVGNVIAGKVVFTVDCRHTDDGILAAFCEEMQRTMREMAAQLRLEIDIEETARAAAVPMDGAVVKTVEAACHTVGAACMRMPSGAGHDAQILASAAPAGMIFVPSIGGISHSPLEETRAEDMALGAQVLAETLYRLAWQDGPA